MNKVDKLIDDVQRFLSLNTKPTDGTVAPGRFTFGSIRLILKSLQELVRWRAAAERAHVELTPEGDLSFSGSTTFIVTMHDAHSYVPPTVEPCAGDDGPGNHRWVSWMSGIPGVKADIWVRCINQACGEAFTVPNPIIVDQVDGAEEA